MLSKGLRALLRAPREGLESVHVLVQVVGKHRLHALVLVRVVVWQAAAAAAADRMCQVLLLRLVRTIVESDDG